MELSVVNNLLNQFEEKKSTVMYPMFAERLEVYTCEDLPYREEFLFFEDKYLAIKKHMIENDIDGDILDIGCQHGFQSEIFLDNKSYTGIDVDNCKFFNTDKENIRYIKGLYPRDIDFDLDNYIVFSIMSLGYFNGFLSNDEEVAIDKIVDSLKNIKKLYIATHPKVMRKLEKYYSKKEYITGKVIKTPNSGLLDNKSLEDDNTFITYYLSK